MLVKAGDTIAIKNRPRTMQLVKLNLQENPPPVPDYLEPLPPNRPREKCFVCRREPMWIRVSRKFKRI